jgi:hypothetical protein
MTDGADCRFVQQALVLFAFVLVLAAGAAADEEKELHAVHAAAPPRIDGKLDDACWSKAAKAENFLLNTTVAPATQKTEALVCYDDNALYVAFVCQESARDKIVALQTKNGAKVAKDDCVEVFLDAAHDHFNYRHFVVNPNGAQYDEAGDGAGVDTTWDAPWQSAASRTADGWVAEMALPFAALELNKHVSSTWGVNFCREERPRGELSTWSPVKGKFAQPANFGRICGLDVDFSPFLVSLALDRKLEVFSGENVLGAKVANASTSPRNIILEMMVAPEGGELKAIKGEPIALAPQAEKAVQLKYVVDRVGATALTLRALDAGTGRLVAATRRTVEMPPLAEFFLFESYYRGDTVLRAKLNVRSAAGYGLTADLRSENGAETTSIVKEAAFAGNTMDVPFNVSKLGVGEYVVRAAVVAPQGTAPISEELRFRRLRPPGSSPGRVSIRDDNMLLVDGKPFFPLGVYFAPFTDRGLSEASKAGFNLVLCPAAPEASKSLRKFEEYGLKVWMPIGGLLKFDKDAPKKLAKLKEMVERFKNEKALLVWESIDEPVWGSNTEGLLDGYRALKALDPDHPVWTNHAPRNTIAELTRFDAATDIAGCDIYPVPEPQSQSDLPNKTISVVADETEKQQTTVARRKPVWMVLQGFAWAELWKKKGLPGNPVFPTYEQSRFMAYDAIVHGARGVLYWGTRYTERPSRFLNEVRRVISELSDLSDVLTAADSKAPVRVEQADLPIKILVKDVGAERYFLAVNESARPTTAAIVGLDAKVAQLAVFGEERMVPVTGGRFTDDFSPYAVHVYSTDTKITSIVANHSFEKDIGDDDLPDGWTLRVPFSGGMTRAEAHTGRCSAYLEGGEDESSVMWIQDKLSIVPKKPYHCSAWIKGQGSARVYVEWTDGKGKFGGKVPAFEPATGEWKETAFDFTAPAAAPKTIYVVLQLKGKGQVYFDDVRIFDASK